MKKMYKEGGLATDGMDVDPVSGNDIPPGSNAEDVRDDVDLKASSGEYIVPADVVKYFGVAYFEKLRSKAKAGLEEMDEDGRIGGEPVREGKGLGMPEGNYAIGGMVPGSDIDNISERVKAAAVKDPSAANMLKSKGIFIQEPQPKGLGQQQAMDSGTIPSQAAPPKMQGLASPTGYNVGGMVAPDPTSQFDPYAYKPGFSALTNVTGQPVPALPGPQGQTCSVGYMWDVDKGMCVPDPNATPVAPTPVTAPATTRSSNDNDSMPTTPADPNKWMEKYDYSNPETLYNQTMTTLGAGAEPENKGVVGSLLGFASNALAGGLIGKFISATNVAQASANAVILRESGRTASADKLDKAIADYAKAKGVSNLSDFTTGKRLAESAQSVNKSNIDKWGTGAGADQVTEEMVKEGIEYAKKGDDRDTEWEGQGPAITNSKNTSKKSSAAEFIKKTQESGAAARQRAKDSADKAGRKLATGGRATGGLVGPRPSKAKTKPKGKRGLGSK